MMLKDDEIFWGNNKTSKVEKKSHVLRLCCYKDCNPVNVFKFYNLIGHCDRCVTALNYKYISSHILCECPISQANESQSIIRLILWLLLSRNRSEINKNIHKRKMIYANDSDKHLEFNLHVHFLHAVSNKST